MKVGDLVIVSDYYKEQYRNFPPNPGVGIIVKLGAWQTYENKRASYTVSWSNWNGEQKEKIMTPKWLELFSESG